MPSSTLLASALLVKGANQVWSAQCIELDIAGQGGTVDEAKTALIENLAGQWFLDKRQGRQPMQMVRHTSQGIVERFAGAPSLDRVERILREGDEQLIVDVTFRVAD